MSLIRRFRGEQSGSKAILQDNYWQAVLCLILLVMVIYIYPIQRLTIPCFSPINIIWLDVSSTRWNLRDIKWKLISTHLFYEAPAYNRVS